MGRILDYLASQHQPSAAPAAPAAVQPGRGFMGIRRDLSNSNKRAPLAGSENPVAARATQNRAGRMGFPSPNAPNNNASRGPFGGSVIAKDDGGVYSQPSKTGKSKASQRSQEHAYTGSSGQRGPNSAPTHTATPAAGAIPPRGNHGDMRSGIETAMGSMADKMHPVQHKSPPVAGKVPPKSLGVTPSYSQVQANRGSGKTPRKG